MPLLDQLKIFIKGIVSWVVTFAGFTIFFLVFGLGKVAIFGKTIFLPLTTGDSFSVQVFKILEHDFLPAGVQIIVTNPWSGFVVQLEIALTLAFIITAPFFLYKILRFVSPALFESERKAIYKSLAVSTALFFLGCLFAFYFMIPLTFKFMYPFSAALGVLLFFSLDSFISWTLAIFITTGVIFLLPVFMIILTNLRVVSPYFWSEKWRLAFLILLIFSAIITPDQTGFTMILLFIPLAVLYSGGAFVSGKLQQPQISDN